MYGDSPEPIKLNTPTHESQAMGINRDAGHRILDIPLEPESNDSSKLNSTHVEVHSKPLGAVDSSTSARIDFAV